MRYIFAILIVLVCSSTQAQKHKDTVLWAFPITDYTVKLNDSTTAVQVLLPEQLHFVLNKQFGLLRGIYRDNSEDTGRKGWGRCHLIKGQYNYFAIHVAKGKKPRKDDVLYSFIPAPAGGYQSPLFYCASHNITFTNVSDSAFYQPNNYLVKRTQQQDDALLDKMVDDIQFTGKYFLENDSSMNKSVETGMFKGQRVLNQMMAATKEDLVQFLQYAAARNVVYGGNKWKVSETYATWVVSGAPTRRED